MGDKTAQERADELAGENKTLKARVVELEGLVASGAQAAEGEKLKELQTKLDEANGKIGRFDETFQKAVRERAKLEREAGRIMGAEFRLDDMTERQIHETVVKRLDGGADIKTPSDAELRGQYNALLALAVKNAESQQRVGEILSRSNDGPDRKDADTESFEDVEKNRWKKTLSNGRAAAEGR